MKPNYGIMAKKWFQWLKRLRKKENDWERKWLRKKMIERKRFNVYDISQYNILIGWI